ncbi:MAG: DNA double-strand break repair nuclease NurA [Candidatus Bathyarchaeota archaeon]|nr:DNA double-strand break repair nuclease NurA [Candidatus Bathyarchaeota archaeon]
MDVHMPEFLEEFASSVSTKKETLKEKIFKGTPNPLQRGFERHFKSHWIPLSETEKYSSKTSEVEIMAVDSSVYTNLLSTGGIFYVIRSLAVCRDQEKKLLETDAFFTKASFLESQLFVGRKMEMFEFLVAIDALKSGFKCCSILIDGSLYGRVSHVPIETKVEDQRLVLLHYFQVYRELLDLCKSEKILLMGVSKESRSTFYRDYLLKLIFEETLKSLDSSIDTADLHRLKPIFAETLDDEKTALRKFAKLHNKYGKRLDSVALILEELISSRPDYQLIMNYAQTPGYTQPLLLGPSARTARRLEACLKDPARYVRAHFPATVREKGKDFVDWASNILLNLAGFPGIISFYLLLDVRDSPIRIDIPCWDHIFARTGWPKPIDFDVDEVLKVMVTGYCGLDCYNLWLKNVDERVRLKKRVVDNLYFPFMERLFGEKIIRGRGYRRVKYP